MTSSTQSTGMPTRILALLYAAACFGLGIIALYSSGIGLIDPKFHRAVGFGLALIVAVPGAGACLGSELLVLFICFLGRTFLVFCNTLAFH